MRIYLIGFMGSGKSTVGQLLSRQMQVSFLDSDQWIEEQTGMTVASIFAERGESVFRDMERRFLLAVNNFSGVISCGGGLPCYNNLMDEMLRDGTTVYLRTGVAVLEERLKLDRHLRPLLKTEEDENLEAIIRNRMADRIPVYERATCVVDTDGKSPEEIAREIAAFL